MSLPDAGFVGHAGQGRRYPGFARALAGLWRSVPGRLQRRMTGGAYRAEIDGLRFFAIAIVVIGHFSERAVRFFPRFDAMIEDNPALHVFLMPGLGVYLFFAISGFIIATQAMKAKASPLSGAFLSSYFGRRVLRIEPPYVVLLVATWAVIALTGYAPEGTRQFYAQPQSLGLSLLGSIFYLHDLLWGTFPRLFPPGWSLEIEVQFYLIAPLLFWVFFGLRSRASRLAFGFALLFGASLLSLVAPDQIGPLSVKSSILRFAHFFWLGILLADSQSWIAARLGGLSAALCGLIGWAGLILYLAAPNAPDDNLLAALAIRAWSLAAVAAMFASVFAPASSFRTFCSRPWISLVGGACYSIYLTHLQVIQVVAGAIGKHGAESAPALVVGYGAVAVLAVIVVGLGFYAIVERTFMLPKWPQLMWQRVRFA